MTITCYGNSFYVGLKVKTRGDLGSFCGKIVSIQNDHYCTIRAYGKDRHMNMAFLEPR